MVAVGLRERKKEQTREALALAVLRLSKKRGFDNVTVEEIAEACDVSPRTFFRYFASKEDALFASNSKRRDRVSAALQEQPTELPVFDALVAALLTLVTAYEGDHDMLHQRHRIIVSSPSLLSRSVERSQSWESALVDELRESGRSPNLSDFELRLVVASTLSTVRLAVDAWLLPGEERSLHELFEVGFRRLRGGLSG
jgi:AcrR family transcriptional regulator